MIKRFLLLVSFFTISIHSFAQSTIPLTANEYKVLIIDPLNDSGWAVPNGTPSPVFDRGTQVVKYPSSTKRPEKGSNFYVDSLEKVVKKDWIFTSYSNNGDYWFVEKQTYLANVMRYARHVKIFNQEYFNVIVKMEMIISCDNKKLRVFDIKVFSDCRNLILSFNAEKMSPLVIIPGSNSYSILKKICEDAVIKPIPRVPLVQTPKS